MSRTKRAAATTVIMVVTSLGVAGVANASDYVSDAGVAGVNVGGLLGSVSHLIAALL
jgi:hypothetical protein